MDEVTGGFVVINILVILVVLVMLVLRTAPRRVPGHCE
jgi:hypothetical protein